MNPANYEGWVDPDGGQWIKLKHGACAGVIWRPVDMQMDENDQLKFGVELFEGPGIPTITEENEKIFGNFCRGVITDILGQESAEIQSMAEQMSEPEEPEDETSDGGIILQTNPWAK